MSDAVHVLPDGTICVIRGGIGRIRAPSGQPALLRAAAMLRLEQDEVAPGAHTFEVDIVDAANRRLDLTGLVEADSPPLPFRMPVTIVAGRPAQFVANMQVPFVARETYALVFRVDDTEVYRVKLEIEDLTPADLQALGVIGSHESPR